MKQDEKLSKIYISNAFEKKMKATSFFYCNNKKSIVFAIRNVFIKTNKQILKIFLKLFQSLFGFVFKTY